MHIGNLRLPITSDGTKYTLYGVYQGGGGVVLHTNPQALPDSVHQKLADMGFEACDASSMGEDELQRLRTEGYNL